MQMIWSPCFSSEFTCHNGLHIPASWECDGLDDCGDGSDEISCGKDRTKHIMLMQNMWSWCAPFTRPLAIGCGSGLFTCDSGGCIPDYWECDGWADCGDGSDEISCGKDRTKHIMLMQNMWSWCAPFTRPLAIGCGSGLFTCDSGECIPASWECDGWYDCGDGSDESSCGKVYINLTCDHYFCSVINNYPWQVVPDSM